MANTIDGSFSMVGVSNSYGQQQTVQLAPPPFQIVAQPYSPPQQAPYVAPTYTATQQPDQSDDCSCSAAFKCCSDICCCFCRCIGDAARKEARATQGAAIYQYGQTHNNTAAKVIGADQMGCLPCYCFCPDKVDQAANARLARSEACCNFAESCLKGTFSCMSSCCSTGASACASGCSSGCEMAAKCCNGCAIPCLKGSADLCGKGISKIPDVLCCILKIFKK